MAFTYHSTYSLFFGRGTGESGLRRNHANSGRTVYPSEYWMFYRGPGFSPPYDFPISSPIFRQYSKVDRRLTGRLRKSTTWVSEDPNHTSARKPGPLKIIQYTVVHPFWPDLLQTGVRGRLSFLYTLSMVLTHWISMPRGSVALRHRMMPARMRLLQLGCEYMMIL